MEGNQGFQEDYHHHHQLHHLCISSGTAADVAGIHGGGLEVPPISFPPPHDRLSELNLSSSATLLPWPTSPMFVSPQINQPSFFHSPLPPLPPPPPPPPFFSDFFSRRAVSFDGGGGSSSSDPLGFSESLHAELMNKMTAQDIMDAKALAASKSHSEAERRRRERINAHLAKLRSLLPSTTKTDKASLLAEVIQHVKELKRQTSQLAEESGGPPLPTESDELTVDATNDEEGRLVVKASLCCDDRSDLLPDIIKALKSLHLRTLRAEITTLGGRVKNVLIVTTDDGNDDDLRALDRPPPLQYSIAAIHDALKTVMDRPAAAEENSSGGPTSASGGTKRQRTNNLSATILEHRSI